MFFCHTLQNPRKRSCEFNNTELDLYAAKKHVCEWSIMEKEQNSLDGQTGPGQQRIFATSNIYPSLLESQIVSVLVGVHVCLNTALSGLLDVLFWQTESSADGQASSS